MPASLLMDMNSHGGGGLEDQRALQLALELSMMGLNTEDDGNSNHTLNVTNVSTFNDDHGKMKKSANMTECVPVPSSEHVAEIVGRQGCKIKALRAKTNTYIKTPVRGEEPVFVVTGRKEDVGAAKREILSAAEHFSQIRASRRQNTNSSTSMPGIPPGPPSPNAPGQVTIQVRVPYRVVGLVVGPKGATIKRIQQTTHTYIVTPSRDKEPVFEVTGTLENVEKARQEIESHIAMRTGGLVDSNITPNPHVPNVGMPPSIPPPDEVHLNQLNDFHSNGVDSGFHDLGNDLLCSIYKPPSTNSAFTSTYNSALNNSNNLLSQPRSQDINTVSTNIFSLPPLNGSSKLGDFTTGLTNGFSNGFAGFYDNDEGIASPSFDAPPVPVTTTTTLWPDLSGSENSSALGTLFSSSNATNGLPRRSNSMSNSTTPRLSPTLTDSSSSSPPTVPTEHTSVRRIRSDPLSGGLSAMSAFVPLPAQHQNGVVNPVNATCTSSSGASMSGSTSTGSASPTESPDALGSPPRRRNCLVCSEGDIVAALVPCGHNLFCMECANLIVDKPLTDRRCPVCQQPPTQAIRIFS